MDEAATAAAPTALATTLRIDAAALPPDDRVEAVRDAIWRLVVRVEIEQPPAPLVDARCRLRSLGPVTQCSVQANASTIRRTTRLARDDLEPSLFLGLQVSGTSLVVQDGREAELRPGDLALYDTTRPYTLVNRSGIDHHYFRIPRTSLALPSRAIDGAVATTFSTDQPLVGVASAFFMRLADQPELPTAAQAAIGVPAVELVRALLTTRTGARRLARESLASSLVGRVLTYTRLHLADPGLTPQQIAAAHHVSVRHLYAVLAGAEISLAGWIRTQRLEACRIELARPLQHQVPIAVVAARWGFMDPTHFSRAFRAEFGQSPREWRRRSQAARG
jgi:AraC-like DNA-binding protein